MMNINLIVNHSQAISMANNNTKFTNRSLLEWIRSSYKININDIEHCCTGAVYCQILDSIHPGKVKMNKVNWKAKHEHEFTNNFKILQEAFNEIKITKHIEISKLTKRKLNDNLEFLQWVRNYFDNNYVSLENYDALKRRYNAELAPLPMNENSKKDESGSKSVEKFSSKLNLNNLNNIHAVSKVKNAKLINNLSVAPKIIVGSKKSSNDIETNNKAGERSVNNQAVKLANTVITFSRVKVNPFECGSNVHNHLEESKKQNTANKNSANPQKLDAEKENVNPFSMESSDDLKTQLIAELKIKDKLLEENERRLNLFKNKFTQVGRQSAFYLSKLKDIEYLFNEKNKLVSDGELKDLVNKILYAQKEVEIEIDSNLDVRVNEI